MFNLIILFFLRALADPQPLSIEVYERMDKILKMVNSPDGQKVGYIVSQCQEDSYARTIKLVIQTITENPKESEVLTTIENVADFCWNGKSDLVAFITADAPNVLKTQKITDKEATPAVTFPLPISMLKWSASENIFLFTASVFPGMTMQETLDYKTERKNNYNSNGIVFDSLPVSKWSVMFSEGTYCHVFVLYVTVNEDGTYHFSETAHDAMPHFKGNVPDIPTSSSSDFAISGDGKFLAWSSQPSATTFLTLTHQIYLRGIPEKEEDFETSDFTTCLTQGVPGTKAAPLFSPDNRYLAFVLDCEEGDVSRQDVCVFDLFTKQTRVVMPDSQVQLRGMCWSAFMPKTIIVSALEHAKCYVYPVNIETGEISTKNRVYSVSGVSVISSTRILYLRSTFSTPPNIYTSLLFPPEEGKEEEVQLTDLHKTIWDNLIQKPYEPEEIELTATDGDKMYAWYFTQPHNSSTYEGEKKDDDDKNIPLLVYVHGGPEYCAQNMWDETFMPQIMLMGRAENNYAMLVPHIHGSTSYGREYEVKIRKRWSSLGLPDVLAAREQTLNKYPTLNSSRTAMAGHSFGGHMADLLACQGKKENNPFVAILSWSGSFDLPQLFSGGDLGLMGELYAAHAPWDDRTLADEMSPHTQEGVGFFSTPILLAQGLGDYRVAPAHSISFFNLLQRVFEPDTEYCGSYLAKLILFPDESHQYEKAANMILLYNQSQDWLDKFLSDEEVGKTIKRKERQHQRLLEYKQQCEQNNTTHAYTHNRFPGRNNMMNTKNEL